ncbi:hypothetical protein [Bailinhaonella thermotolerans]|uniref:hypothetical protein n=1 Tax=Bailinhaonella thermotolerans TaxID=1070861 RepID=UPI00192A46E6|nr:hypothetical protein [Bailinhaonella thermotolerans]
MVHSAIGGPAEDWADHELTNPYSHSTDSSWSAEHWNHGHNSTYAHDPYDTGGE